MGVGYDEANSMLTRCKEDYIVALRDLLSQWDLKMKGVTRKQLEDALDGAEVGGLCSIVEKHYEKGNIQSFLLMVHVGVSSVASELTLEQQGHNKGYNKPDVTSKFPETKDFNCIIGGPDCILSHINMAVASDKLNRTENCPVKAVVSYNAGRSDDELIFDRWLVKVHDRGLTHDDLSVKGRLEIQGDSFFKYLDPRSASLMKADNSFLRDDGKFPDSMDVWTIETYIEWQYT
eukprot:XP_011682629.1 PREDICTED: uncharacterized protein LOC752387 [Strongylocentrotus purpuratus]